MTMPAVADEFLTAQELADRWKRRLEAIYWMRNRGEGPIATRVGRELRFRLVDVIEWEEQQRDADRQLRDAARARAEGGRARTERAAAQ